MQLLESGFLDDPTSTLKQTEGSMIMDAELLSGGSAANFGCS